MLESLFGRHFVVLVLFEAYSKEEPGKRRRTVIVEGRPCCFSSNFVAREREIETDLVGREFLFLDLVRRILFA